MAALELTLHLGSKKVTTALNCQGHSDKRNGAKNTTHYGLGMAAATVEKKRTFDTTCKLNDIGHTVCDSLHVMWPTSLAHSQTAILFQLRQNGSMAT